MSGWILSIVLLMLLLSVALPDNGAFAKMPTRDRMKLQKSCIKNGARVTEQELSTASTSVHKGYTRWRCFGEIEFQGGSGASDRVEMCSRRLVNRDICRFTPHPPASQQKLYSQQSVDERASSLCATNRRRFRTRCVWQKKNPRAVGTRWAHMHPNHKLPSLCEAVCMHAHAPQRSGNTLPALAKVASHRWRSLIDFIRTETSPQHPPA